MKKIILAAALAVVPALFSAEKAAAQQGYATEVCVNASLANEAKQLFPNASLHVLPDFPDPEMNGWTIVSGNVRSDGGIMTDAEEIKIRLRDRNRSDNAE
jgi:hypothetical protein